MVKMRKLWKVIENFMVAVVMEWCTNKVMIMSLQDYI